MVRRSQRWVGPELPERDADQANVVVECADAAEGWIVGRALAEAGHRIATCTGPDASTGPCPLVDGRGCSAAERADVVVNLLGIGSINAQQVLGAVHDANRQATFVVRVAPADAQRISPLVEGCVSTLVPLHASVGTIVDAVSRALAG